MNSIKEKNLREISGFSSTPHGWREMTIDEICNIGRGRVISIEEIKSNPGDYPVFSSQTRNKGKMGAIGTYDFDGDYVTWTTDGENAGTVFYRTGKFNCTNVCGTLKAKKLDEVDLQFLSYHLGRIAKKYVSYIGNPKLMNGVMANIGLALPEIWAQQKIAKILTTIDQLIEKTQALIDKHTAIKQGMMTDLFTRGIDPATGQLRPPVEQAPHLYKETELGWVPKDWNVNDFADVAEIIDPQPDHRTPPEAENGVPYIGVSDFLADGTLDMDSARKVIPEAYNKQNKRFQVDKGDIVYGKIGTIGEPKYLLQTKGFALSANIVLIKPKINPEYILSYLATDVFNKQVKLSINTTSQPALGIEKIRNLKVMIPTNDELKNIANLLQNLRKKHHVKTRFLQKQINIKAGLMQSLLTGKVVV